MSIQISLADDHQLVRKGIRLLLENISDVKVTIEASNGRELIDQIVAAEKLPDLVLIDVNMPVMSGQETVQELRMLYPELKLIALSVNDELHIIREMIQLGANAYLFKDSSPEKFKKTLFEVYEKGFYYDKQVVESLLAPDHEMKDGRGRDKYKKLLEQLTNRELEFVRFSCSELTYKEIASKMGVSLRTVDGYRENAFDKLDVKSRTGLVLFAFNSGIIEGNMR